MNRKFFIKKYSYKKFFFMKQENFKNKLTDLEKVNKSTLLYKYCSLDNNYIIENIRNNILYFSNPANFNDPFDSVLSISLFDILSEYSFSILKNRIKHDTELDIEKSNYYIKCLEKKEIEENKIVEFLDYMFNYCNNNLKNVSLPFQNTNEFIIKLMECVKDDNSLNKLIEIFGKDKINIRDIQDLLNIFKINNNKMNEVIEKTDDFQKQIEEELRNSINNAYRICCFTNSYDNVLMWSHYANKHKGICIEYELTKMDSLLISYLYPVVYSNERIKAKLEHFNLNGEKLEINKEEILNLVFQSLIHKSSVWDYENEWRIIIPKKILNSDDTIKAPKIKRIFFGVNLSKEDFIKYQEIIKKIDKNIECIKLHIDDDKYILKK